MLTSATRGETPTPNPNECNSTLTSGTNNIYPYPYIDVNDRGHRFRSGSPLTNYPHAMALKQGRQKRYSRYDHGPIKFSHILLEMNNKVFKKP